MSNGVDHSFPVRWAGREVALPEPIAASLAVLLETGVEHVRIYENSLFVRLHGPAVATTRRRCIYLRGGASDFFDNPWLMLHEYWHVIKQWEPRTLTIRSYLLECLRRGYWNNRFEVEARAFADTSANRLREMLASRVRAVALDGDAQPSSASRS